MLTTILHGLRGRPGTRSFTCAANFVKIETVRHGLRVRRISLAGTALKAHCNCCFLRPSKNVRHKGASSLLQTRDMVRTRMSATCSRIGSLIILPRTFRCEIVRSGRKGGFYLSNEPFFIRSPTFPPKVNFKRRYANIPRPDASTTPVLPFVYDIHMFQQFSRADLEDLDAGEEGRPTKRQGTRSSSVRFKHALATGWT